MIEQWFGKNWGAPACEARNHAKTPVGELCARCYEPILVGHRGILRAHIEDIVEGQAHYTVRPIHLDCVLASHRPHGPECPHCRGKDIDEHTDECRASEVDFCTCMPIPEGKQT